MTNEEDLSNGDHLNDDGEDIAAEHAAMLAGDETAKAMHDPYECELCIELQPAIQNICRCGECCRSLILEATLRDAEREPKIKERDDPIYHSPELTTGGHKELIGYMLNQTGTNIACIFLDEASSVCTIYATRPLMCRLFDCDAAGRERLIELCIIKHEAPS